jgi:hypothetical protein
MECVETKKNPAFLLHNRTLWNLVAFSGQWFISSTDLLFGVVSAGCVNVCVGVGGSARIECNCLDSQCSHLLLWQVFQTGHKNSDFCSCRTLPCPPAPSGDCVGCLPLDQAGLCVSSEEIVALEQLHLGHKRSCSLCHTLSACLYPELSCQLNSHNS